MSLIVHPVYGRELRLVILEAVFLTSALFHVEPHFEALPNEMVLLIASKVSSGRDLAALSLVNRHTHAVIKSEDVLWKDLCKKTYGLPPRDPPSWKDLYRFQHLLFRDIASQAALKAVANGLGMQGGQIVIPPVF